MYTWKYALYSWVGSKNMRFARANEGRDYQERRGTYSTRRGGGPVCVAGGVESRQSDYAATACTNTGDQIMPECGTCPVYMGCWGAW